MGFGVEVVGIEASSSSLVVVVVVLRFEVCFQDFLVSSFHIFYYWWLIWCFNSQMRCLNPPTHARRDDVLMIMMLFINVLCWNMLDLGENGVMMKYIAYNPSMYD